MSLISPTMWFSASSLCQENHPAQLDIEIRYRFGNPVKPREWFLVPLFVVNEVVERIKDGSITQ
jgi:hypothetical protein